MKTCLIISPHFPPSTLAGVHRARHLIKHLPSHGWRTKVICVDPRFHNERLDPDLAGLVSNDAEVIHVGALPVKLTQLVGVAGDIGLRGLGHIRAAVAREMRADKPDVVMITGSPYFPMLLAKWIEQRWRTPVILDFQDPWVSQEGVGRPFGTKAWLAHRLAVVLEPMAVRPVSFVTSVSDRQNDDMAERYPWLDRSRMAGIPIGGDPEDFKALHPGVSSDGVGDSRHSIILSYVGTALPRSGPVLRALFKGLSSLTHHQPQIARRIKLRFVGTSNQPDDSKTYRVTPIADEEGVGSNVTEEPARVPYLDALRILSRTDIVMMIGSDEPHYTASKIYPGLMCGRPFLSLFHRASSAHRILSSAGGGAALAFETAAELDALAPEIATALETLVIRPETFGNRNRAAYEPFTAHAIAGRFAGVFDRLLDDRITDQPAKNAS